MNELQWCLAVLHHSHSKVLGLAPGCCCTRVAAAVEGNNCASSRMSSVACISCASTIMLAAGLAHFTHRDTWCISEAMKAAAVVHVACFTQLLWPALLDQSLTSGVCSSSVHKRNSGLITHGEGGGSSCCYHTASSCKTAGALSWDCA